MCHLFGEGNDLFREGEWTKSIEMYTEALNIAEYADSEEICIPAGLLEKLYANRAAAYLNIVPVSICGLTITDPELNKRVKKMNEAFSPVIIQLFLCNNKDRHCQCLWCCNDSQCVC